MSTRKNDDRLEAFNAIVSLLSKFDDETQRHANLLSELLYMRSV